MTRKDYIKIAEVIKNNTTVEQQIIMYQFIDELCTVFKDDNPNFNRAKFVDACMINMEDV